MAVARAFFIITNIITATDSRSPQLNQRSHSNNLPLYRPPLTLLGRKSYAPKDYHETSMSLQLVE